VSIQRSKPSHIVEILEELNPEAILYDGLDDALVGITARCGTDAIALYDREKCIEIFMASGMSNQEAEEYFCFNVEGCYAGPHTPFIASFDLHPIGIRYPVEDLQVSAGSSADTEMILGFDADGNAHVDFANVGAVIVDSATESVDTVGPNNGDEVATGTVIVDGDVES